MTRNDRDAFAELLTQALGFYGQTLSPFALSVWWQACEVFSIEQVGKALTAHAMDPDKGHFAPKPADVVRQLHGTHADRSLVAWGKVLHAMSRVGAYASVAFDDAAIHAAIVDTGGWPKLCRSEIDDLPFTQKRFCDLHRVYAQRPSGDYPAVLIGDHDAANSLRGLASQPPALVGDPAAARRVMAGGGTQRALITSAADAAARPVAALLDSPSKESA